MKRVVLYSVLLVFLGCAHAHHPTDVRPDAKRGGQAMNPETGELYDSWFDQLIGGAGSFLTSTEGVLGVGGGGIFGLALLALQTFRKRRAIQEADTHKRMTQATVSAGRRYMETLDEDESDEYKDHFRKAMAEGNVYNEFHKEAVGKVTDVGD